MFFLVHSYLMSVPGNCSSLARTAAAVSGSSSLTLRIYVPVGLRWENTLINIREVDSDMLGYKLYAGLNVQRKDGSWVGIER